MSKKITLTEQQISVFLLMKLLNDFRDEGYENATFTEKYDAFEDVESAGISREDYDNCVAFWIANGIIRDSGEEHIYSITKKGEKIFKKLDELKDSSDEKVAKAVREMMEQSTPKAIFQWIKEHPQEALMIFGLLLQMIQIGTAL